VITMYPAILADILDIMSTMADDWEYGEEIAESTFLFRELGFESLDLVVLGTSLQERYGRMPFAEFLADIGQREIRDVTVGELVAFVHENAGNIQAGGSH
jgi:acyl carrier protein